ncbi:MAG: hypothetical protein CMK09_12145 [Ponticaulis sp.]|nr:hypothetical protein [Ponticaulis sp.]|tara:strand:- start:7577 stop:8026 length:450 start_codon:yes stop_codon:yes gene_type:complete
MSEKWWETTPMADMDTAQWEALCDGCAKCCLLKLEDEDTGEIAYTRLHCKSLDGESCLCTDYANRKAIVPDCVKLTPDNLSALKWMPKTCAYRLLNEGKPLFDWHPLISGDPNSVHEAGVSIKGRTLNEETVFEGDAFDWIVDWEGNEP